MFGDRGADCVGTALLLKPTGARRQRNALGLVQEKRVAKRVHQHAAVVGKNHDALRVPDLVEQVFHDGARVGEQFVVASKRLAQLATAGVFAGQQFPHRLQASREAALPGKRKPLVDDTGRRATKLHEVLARLTQRGGGRRVLQICLPGDEPALPTLLVGRV